MAAAINSEFENPFVQAYLQFLAFILPLFQQFNILFQSQKVLFPVLSKESRRFVRQLCGKFIKREFINDEDNLYNLNVYHPHVLLPLEEIQFGPQTIKLIENCGQGAVEQFKLKCLSFYQKAVSDSIKRFPLKESWTNNLDFLDTKFVLDSQYSEKFSKNLMDVLSKFEHISQPNIAFEEFFRVKDFFSPEEKQRFNSMTTIEFWQELSELKNFNDDFVFKNISNVAMVLMSIPHGNADVERIFSTMSDIKTKKRNKLGIDTLCALLKIQLNMKQNKKCCLDYEVTADHFKSMAILNQHQSQLGTNAIEDKDSSESD